MTTEIEANWKSNQPSGAQGEDCAVIFAQELRDQECHKEIAFVCEEIAGEGNSIHEPEDVGYTEQMSYHFFQTKSYLRHARESAIS